MGAGIKLRRRRSGVGELVLSVGNGSVGVVGKLEAGAVVPGNGTGTPKAPVLEAEPAVAPGKEGTGRLGAAMLLGRTGAPDAGLTGWGPE